MWQGEIERAFPQNFGVVDEYPPGGLDVFVRMQRDPQIRACLTTKRLSVLSEAAEVRPANDTPEARGAADRVEACLCDLPGGISGLVTGALDALAMGFAVGEMIWSEAGTLENVRWHDPRRFRFLTDAFGQVRELEVIDAGLRLPRERFVVYSYQSRYGNPYGESDLLAAYRPWAAKDLIQRMWLSALDRFGAPIPIAKVPTTWSQSDVDALTALLARLQNESALVVTADVEISAALQEGRVEPARAFHVAAEWLDTQIARAILGQELTTQGSSAGTGSYALGKVHQETLTDWIQSLRSEIAQTVLTDQIARPITMLCCGPGVPPPILRFPNLSQEEMEARVTLIERMTEGGIIAPTENWIRNYLGLPEEQTTRQPTEGENNAS